MQLFIEMENTSGDKPKQLLASPAGVVLLVTALIMEKLLPST